MLFSYYIFSEDILNTHDLQDFTFIHFEKKFLIIIENKDQLHKLQTIYCNNTGSQSKSLCHYIAYVKPVEGTKFTTCNKFTFEQLIEKCKKNLIISANRKMKLDAKILPKKINLLNLNIQPLKIINRLVQF